MPVRTQTQHFPFSTKLDTKQHKFAGEVGLADVTDAEFDDVGAIRKRRGSSSLTLTDSEGNTIRPLGVFNHAGRPVVHDRGATTRFPSLVEGESLEIRKIDDTTDDRQYYSPATVEISDPTAESGDQIFADQATTSTGYTLRAWEWNGTGNIKWVLQDNNGTTVDTDYNNLVGTRPRVRALGNYIHLYYYLSSSNRVLLRVLDTTAAASGFGSAITVYNAFGNVNDYYDVCTNDSDTAWVVVVNTSLGTPGIQIISDDGTLGSTGTQAVQAAGGNQIAIDYSPYLGGVLAVVRVDNAPDLYIDWWDATTLAQEADFGEQLDTDVPHANVTVGVSALGKAYVAYDVATTPGVGPTGHSYYYVKVVGHTLGDGATLGIEATQYIGYKLASRACHAIVGNRNTVLVNLSYVGATATIGGGGTVPSPAYSTNRHYILADILVPNGNTEKDNPVTKGVLAYTLPGTAFVYSSNGLANTYDNEGHLPQLDTLGSEQFSWAAVFERDILRLGSRTGTGPQQLSTWSVKEIKYSLNDSEPLANAEEVNGVTYIPGGFLAQYDGLNICEHGFFTYPEQVLYDQSTTGGDLPDTTTYSYRFYWEWRNAQGQLERSTSSTSYEITTGSGTSENTVTFYVPVLGASLRDRSEVTLAVYRTAGTSSSTYYRISSRDPGDATYVQLDDSSVYVTFEDTGAVADAQLTSNEPDTVFNGNLLDGVPASTPQIISSGQYRLFYVSPEQDNRVRFSNPVDLEETPKFNEALSIAVPERGGIITGIEAGEDAVWIFKKRAVYVASGIGPDSTGAGSYGQPRIVSQDIGCVDSRSILRIPQGIVFKSEKGFYLADRGYGINYIGAGVDDFDSATIRSAIHRPDTHQALFFTNSNCLMYDYLVGAWAVWTIEGETAALCGDDVYWTDYELAGTEVRKLDSSLFKDDGSQYEMSVTTDWVPLNGIAGYGRIRRWGLLGEFRDNCALQVEVGYDRNQAWTDDHLIDLSNEDPAQETYTAGDKINPRRRCSRQKVTAVRFRITDSTYADYDDGSIIAVDDTVILNGLTLEVGVKDGVVKTGQDDNTTAGVLGGM